MNSCDTPSRRRRGGVRPAGPIDIRRRELGFTQAEVAERLDISRSQLSRIEGGLRPNYVTRQCLALVLQTTIEQLWPNP